MTTWNPTIPVPTNVPANDAVSMQQNFQVLDDAFKVNHTPLAVATDQGKHTVVNFPKGSDQGTGPNDVALYAKDVVYPAPFGTITELFFRRQGNGVATQLTDGNGKPGVNGNYGQSFLPGGFQLRWGHIGMPAGGAVTLTYASVGLDDFPNGVAMALATGNSSTSNVISVTFALTTTSQITVSSTGPAAAMWLVIGY